MERRLSAASRRSAPSPIQQLSHLAQRVGAVNLAEGFPDFPAPPHVKAAAAAAAAAIAADHNQYRHVQGICDILAEMAKRDHGLDVDPLTDFVICCGQSEAFAAAIFAIIDPGDEVLLFDPAYETYETCIELARGVPVNVPLDPPSWTLNEDEFLKSFTSRTKAVVLNSPHNPTGKVFSKEELLIIAQACQKVDCFAITDDVYEYITYHENKHISLASLPGMQERTVITSSLSKTYSVTGWRIGWACSPASIASAIRNIHVKLTDSAPALFQEAALIALTSTLDFYSSLKTDYEVRRDFILQLLEDFGFHISFKPQGSVFVFAELPSSWQISDIDFVMNLINDAGVAAVPGRGFFHRNCDGESYHHQYVRFAFCKSDDTLMAAALRMRKLASTKGKTWLIGSGRQEDHTVSASP
ncbi:probable N-succinyldiaminopimelate aminotransferase DapC isoform X2 [Panicum virgatum]|uniref:probable N-succinyldiaminopimelate aminotransferase DapC isoform X2 n=1 Tax=Panicum virgatum TaxID=38727 RepID=UPI0019D5E15F|nr:probable N-succinyldiaminopimelate aminotransferase DapC isoform X2 [Panicum virgatum]